MGLIHGLGQLAMSNGAMASTLKVTADRLGEEATRLGVALGVFFLVLSGGMIAMGRQDGHARLMQAIVGLIIILSATGIIRLIKGLV